MWSVIGYDGYQLSLFGLTLPSQALEESIPIFSEVQITSEEDWWALIRTQWANTNSCLSSDRTLVYTNAYTAIHVTEVEDDPVQLLYFEDSRACPACHHSCPHNTFPSPPPPAFLHRHQNFLPTFLLPVPCGVLDQGIWHNSSGRTTWSDSRGSDLGKQAAVWRIILPLWLPSNNQGCHSLALQGQRGTSGNLSQEDASIPSGS